MILAYKVAFEIPSPKVIWQYSQASFKYNTSVFYMVRELGEPNES